MAVSTGVRSGKSKGIISIDDKSDRMRAMNHDFHNTNATASISLQCNIPDVILGSFFVGDDDNGSCMIFLALRCSTFDPFEVFDHCAQLIDVMKRAKLNPTVLMLQTDGGIDHSLKRLATKLALIALYIELDLDHLVVLCCAPNGLARNKVERSMFILNLGLAHVALKRARMAAFAENIVSSCSSMQDIRDAAQKVEKHRIDFEKKVVLLKDQLVTAHAEEVSGPIGDLTVPNCTSFFILLTFLFITSHRC